MRKVVILCLMAGLLLMGGVVSAQDAAPVFCGTLAQADCSILQQSSTAMKSLNSADVSFNLSFSGENIPNMPTTEPLTISLAGTGSFSGNPSGLSMSPSSMSDPAAAMTQMATALAGVSAKLNLTLTIPEALTQMAAASSSSSASIPGSIPLNLVLVDGKAYLDLDSLAPVIAASGADTASLPKGWVGIDLVGAINQMAPMMSQMSSMATEEAAASDALTQFMDPTFIGKYLKIERGADATVNGDAVAVFNSTVDIAGLLNDPAIQAEIQKQAAASGSSEAASAAMMASMFANSITVTSTTQIGTADNIVRAASTDISFDATSLMAMAQSSSDSTTSAQPAPVVKMHFDYGLSNLNAAQPITAPEGATLIPLSSLTGDMESDMSGFDTDMSGLDSMMEGMDSTTSG